MSQGVLKKLIIIGGGFAGLRALYRLDEYAYHFEITVVDARGCALEKPALPEVAMESKAPESVCIDLAPQARKHEAAFVEEEVRRIDPKSRRVELASGETLEYDYLLIAAGAVKDYDAIKGYRQYGYSICDDAEALRLHRRLEDFEGGRIVTGAARSRFGSRVEAPKLLAPCEGPIGEVAFMLDHRLRKKGLRDRSEIEVFSPAKIFFEDVGEHSRQEVARIIEKRGIRVHTNKVLQEIGKDRVLFEDGSSMECDLAVIIPPYKAPEFIAQSALGDEEGWVPTDRKMRHLEYPEIYAVGDCNALAQPKLGHIAIHQADVAVSAILQAEGLGDRVVEYRPEVFCIMNMGGHEAVLIYSDALYHGGHDLAWHSPLAKLMKTGFDEEYHFTHGHMPPDTVVEALEDLLKRFSKER